MPDQTFETLLSRQLRTYAEAGVRPIDRFAIAEETIASGAQSGLLRRLRDVRTGWRARPALAMLALLALLVIAGAMLILAAGAARKPLPPVQGYESIFLRASSDLPSQGVDIVALRPDRLERLVKHLGPWTGPADQSFLPSGSLSQDGWVAVNEPTVVGTDTWALIDLADPGRDALMVRAQAGVSGAWSPNGLFASLIPDHRNCCVAQVTDPRAGVTTPLGGVALPGGGPEFMWAADGSGMLTQRDGQFAIQPAYAGPSIPDVPKLAPERSRWVAPGGATFDGCSSACGGDAQRRIWVRDSNGSRVQWYSGELAPARAVDASFAADGRSIWLLLDRTDGADHVAVLARLEAPGQARVVATADLGPGVAALWFEGLAADDSSVAIRHWLGKIGDGTTDGQITDGPTTIIDTGTGTTIAHGDRFIGFVPASVAEAWPGEGQFIGVPDTTEPPVPTVPPASAGHTSTPDPNATPPPVAVPAP
jgi:hypothetical protein